MLNAIKRFLTISKRSELLRVEVVNAVVSKINISLNIAVTVGSTETDCGVTISL